MHGNNNADVEQGIFIASAGITMLNKGGHSHVQNVTTKGLNKGCHGDMVSF